MTKLKNLHKKWMKDPDFRKEYDALEEEFVLMLEVAKARNRFRAQPGRTCPPDEDDAEHDRAARKRTLASLDAHTRSCFAKATGHRLKISFEPLKKERSRA